MKSFFKSIRTSRKSGVLTDNCGTINEHDEDFEETGQWYYLVIEPAGVDLRHVGGSHYSFKTGERLPEGDLVQVDRRLRQGYTQWLRLKTGCWVCDVSPADARVNLVEVVREVGPWSYEAIFTPGVWRVPICDTERSAAPTVSLKKGDVVTVLERYMVVGSTTAFLLLSNQAGYVREDRNQPVSGLISSEAPCFQPALREVGCWNYIVGRASGVTTSSGVHLKEGEVVHIAARQPGSFLSSFLFLDDGSWVMGTVSRSEKQSGKSSLLSMLEVSVERGHWVYTVVAKAGIAIRATATVTNNYVQTRGPIYGEEVAISGRVRCGPTMFLKLADGRGWLFETKNGRQMMALQDDLETGCMSREQMTALCDDMSTEAGSDAGSKVSSPSWTVGS